jgi:hypothetical protein
MNTLALIAAGQFSVLPDESIEFGYTALVIRLY